MRETKKQRITVVNAGGDKTVYKDGGGVGGKGGPKTVHVAQVKIGRPSNAVDMGKKG